MIHAVLNKKTLHCDDFALRLTIYFLLELVYLPLNPISRSSRQALQRGASLLALQLSSCHGLLKNFA